MNGVRQCENLSPILFSILLNDLKQFLISRHVNGLSVDIAKPDIVHYVKLLILLYADDIALFGTSDKDLQHTLFVFEDYCKPMELNLCQKSRHVNNGHFKSKHAILKTTPL